MYTTSLDKFCMDICMYMQEYLSIYACPYWLVVLTWQERNWFTGIIHISG